LKSREMVGDEPFAVVLSDDVVDAKVPALRQMLDVYEAYNAPVVALMEVPRENISAYGVVDGELVADFSGKGRLYRIRDMVEKPKAEAAPSNLAIVGRYILTPDIFHSIESIKPGAGGELQLTDGIKHLLRSRPVYGLVFEGTRYDAGDKQGFLQATVEFALKRADLGASSNSFKKLLKHSGKQHKKKKAPISRGRISELELTSLPHYFFFFAAAFFLAGAFFFAAAFFLVAFFIE
jgi:UTP--glucose-1-phosphate uridylyltransferase